MRMSDISNEYAKALFMLALENNAREEYKNALELVEEVFSENPKYIEFLSGLAIPLDERLNALESAFADAVPREILSFLKILCEKKHIEEFSDCIEKYYAMDNDINRIVNATVTSAVELSDEEKSSLEEKLEKTSGHKVMIEYVIDESIIGGLIVEMDGKIIDTSLKKHLKDVKDVILR